MLFALFLKGFFIGFSIAMPVGPIGLLCIRNSLALGLYGGIFSGLGAACVDALLAGLAGFGVTTFSVFLEAHSSLLYCIGAFFLCFIGVLIIRDSSCFEKSQEKAELPKPMKGLFYAFISTFFLTMINPITIISYAGIYTAISMDIAKNPGMYSILALAGGVFLGALCWWIILSFLTVALKKQLEAKQMRWINIASGSFIICLGIGTFLSLFF